MTVLAIWTVAGQIHELTHAVWVIGILAIATWVLFK